MTLRTLLARSGRTADAADAAPRSRTPSARSRSSRAAASGAWSRRSTSCPAWSSTTSGYTGGGRESDLRAGVVRDDRSCGGRAGRVRPEAGELRAAARGVLAQRRSADADGQFCDRGPQYRQRDLLSRRGTAAARAELEGSARRGAFDRSRSSRRSRRRARSIPPRTTTRTTTRRIRCATSSTAGTAVATRGSPRSGAAVVSRYHVAMAFRGRRS